MEDSCKRMNNSDLWDCSSRGTPRAKGCVASSADRTVLRREIQRCSSPWELIKKMKKLALFTLALCVAPQLAHAQSGSGVVDATATVLSVLTVTEIADLDFGNVTPGSPVTVAPGGGGALGALQIDHNADFNVSVTPPVTLTGPSPGGLPVDFLCGYSAISSTGGLLAAATDCTALPTRSGPGDGSTGTTFLQVGGSILGPSSLGILPGVYSGTMTFTVTSTF